MRKVYFGSRVSAKTVLLAIDDWAVRVKDESQRKALYDIVSAIRGPDRVDTSGVKRKNSARVRAQAFPQWTRSGFGFPGSVNRDGFPLSQTNGGWHYNTHMTSAQRALVKTKLQKEVK